MLYAMVLQSFNKEALFPTQVEHPSGGFSTLLTGSPLICCGQLSQS